MKNATIYSIAALCGLGAFVYTLVARSPSGAVRRRGWGRTAVRAPDVLPQNIPELEALVQRRSQSGRAWYALAERYRDTDQVGAAQDAWAHAAPLRLRAAEQQKTDWQPWFEAGWAYTRAGDPDAARRPLEIAEELLSGLASRNDDETTWHTLAWTRKLLGNDEDSGIAWHRALDRLPPKDSPSIGPGGLYNIACYRALLGDREEALDALGRAVGAGWKDDVKALHDEDLESVRDDPRFKAAVVQMRQAAMGVRIEGGP